MTDRISAPFRYQGYSDRTHRGWKRSSCYVSLSDGAQIAADIYLPEGYRGSGAAPERFPVIVNITPYKRAIIDPATGEAVPHVLSRPGEHTAGMEEFGGEPAGFPHYGYAVVVADTRGYGASYGPPALTFGWRYQQDTGEIIDWIAAQGWCDGNVGMVGGSHHGWTQLAAASRRPQALKAIMPAVVPLDGFTGQFFPGGIFMQSFLTGIGVSEAVRAVQEETARQVCAPVGDAPLPEQAGEVEADVPLAIDYGRQPYIDARAPSGETSRDICANLIGTIAGSGVAIYNLGGWFDGFARGTCELFATLRQSNTSRLAMFPGFHDLVRGFMYDEFGVPVPDLLTERRRFFDRYLRGIDNGIDREPPVLIHVMQGDGWRQENEWPLAREQRKVLYLADDGELKAEAAKAGSDEYQVRLDHDRRYGSNLSSRWTALGGHTPLGSPDMAKLDQHSLTYTTAALEQDLEVTGHGIVRLWVSSTAGDGDFHVFLEDVEPSGRPLLVAEGQLRAGWAALHDNNTMTDTGLDILPKLPWHGYRKSDWQEEILAGGRVVELVIDLTPVSWLFRRGHSLRLSIACANWPDFSLNPTLSPQNDPAAADNVTATVHVHRGGVQASCLDLPVIPQEKAATTAG